MKVTEKPALEKIPEVELTKQQRWELMDEIMRYSSDKWFEGFVQERKEKHLSELTEEEQPKRNPKIKYA